MSSSTYQLGGRKPNFAASTHATMKQIEGLVLHANLGHIYSLLRKKHDIGRVR